MKMANNIYEIKIKDLKGNELNLSTFKGKKWMIVNVASECGFTNQYAQLEELYKNHQDSLAILGCPCNDFGGQEPGGSEDIEQFCTINFGVTFPLTEKLQIFQDPHPLYQFLCSKEKNGKKDYQIFWNFQKFLIEPDGSIFRSLPSNIEPLDDQIIQWIEEVPLTK